MPATLQIKCIESMQWDEKYKVAIFFLHICFPKVLHPEVGHRYCNTHCALQILMVMLFVMFSHVNEL